MESFVWNEITPSNSLTSVISSCVLIIMDIIIFITICLIGKHINFSIIFFLF